MTEWTVVYYTKLPEAWKNLPAQKWKSFLGPQPLQSLSQVLIFHNLHNRQYIPRNIKYFTQYANHKKHI